MSARFDENPAMTFHDIKETKTLQTDGRTHTWTPYMNMFARFDDNPAMTFQDIKETKRYGRMHTWTHAHTHAQRENSIPTTNKVCRGYNKWPDCEGFDLKVAVCEPSTLFFCLRLIILADRIILADSFGQDLARQNG